MTFADRRRIAAAYAKNLTLILAKPDMDVLLELALSGVDLALVADENRPSMGTISRRIGVSLEPRSFHPPILPAARNVIVPNDS